MRKALPLLIIFISFSTFSFAQAGTLDSSFGVNGVITYRYEKNMSTSSVVITQPDSKILVGGTTKVDNIYRFLLIRLNPDGSLDSSFGLNGEVVTSFESGQPATSTCLALQPDGKIIQAGYTNVSSQTQLQIAITRFNSNGSLDTSFSNNGKLTSKITGFANDIILMEDGKIMIGGTDGERFLLARFNNDGKLDKTFGNLGVSYVSFYSGSSSRVFSMAKQSDGKFVLAGGVADKDADYDFGVARFKQDGSLDSTFSNDGVDTAIFVATISLFNYYLENARSVIIQDDNKIVLVGLAISIFASNPSLPGAITMIRYNPDGTRDSSFGINSKIISKINYESLGTSAVLQKDGKILVCGQQKIYGNSLFTSLVARYNESGILDSSFGKYGHVSGDFVYSSEYANDITLQSDNKIIVVGNNDSTIVIARYWNDPSQISIQKSIAVTEGNSGFTPAQFKVVLNTPATTDVFVNYTTKNLTAIAGSDYTASSGTIRIKAGKATSNIIINVIGDNIIEPREKFAVLLSNPIGAVLGTLDSATCVIKNDDAGFAIINAGEDELNHTNDVKVYPNPLKDNLQIEGLTTAKTILSITDMTGNRILITTVTGNNYKWNISKLKTGSYILNIITGGKIITRTFIKQ